MYDVSVLVASRRDYTRTLETLRAAARASKYSYKMFVYGTEDPRDPQPDLEFIKDTEQAGAVKAYNYLAAQTKGTSEFVITLADGMCIDLNGFVIVDELRALRDASPRIVARGFGCHPVCSLPPRSGLHGLAEIIRYQCFGAESLYSDFEGHIYNPYFKYHVVDNWISVWCYRMGRQIFETTSTYVHNCVPHQYRDVDDAYDDDILVRLCRGFDSNRSYIAAPPD